MNTEQQQSHLTSDCVGDASKTALPPQHTPGPWTVQITGMRGSFHIPQAQQHEAEAAHTDGIDGGTVSHANAALIAAAPDLLEAMRDMLAGWIYIRQCHGDLYGVGWDRAQGKAEAAIEKTGVTP